MLDDVREVLKKLGLFFESDHLPYNIFHKPLDLTASGLGKYCVDAGKTMRSLVGGGMASTMPDEDNNINAMTNLRNTNAAAAIVSQTTRANELVLLWRDQLSYRSVASGGVASIAGHHWLLLQCNRSCRLVYALHSSRV